MNLKKIAVLISFILLAGCSSQQFKKFTAQAISGNEVAYNEAECNAIKVRCPVKSYEEWQTSSGKFGCSCISR